MNLKRLFFFTAELSTATIAPASSDTTTIAPAPSNYIERNITQETASPKLERVAQILWKLGDNDRPVEVIDRAIYSLDEPALQFIYTPNQFVIESFAASLEDAPTANASRIHIWSKADYVTLKSADNKAKDFPPRLTVSIHSNPARLRLEDFITTQWYDVHNPNISSFERKFIAEKEGLSFAHSDMSWSYQSTFVKDANNDGVIAISLGGPEAELRAAGSAGYYDAFEKIERSLKLTNASVDEYKSVDT